MDQIGKMLCDVLIAVVVVGFVVWRFIKPYLICKSVLAGQTGMIGAKYVLFEGVLFTMTGGFFLARSLRPLSNMTVTVICGIVLLAGIWYTFNAVRVFVVRKRWPPSDNPKKGGRFSG
ncbi:MAG: hypothetical protein WC450_03730 [Candidatus Omnitrophota bacterium]|jgi:hypothetical protein